MHLHTGIFFSVLCTGIALVGSSLARAQDAAPATLQVHPQPEEPTPIPRPEKRMSKPTLEISTETPSQKPTPLAEQTPPAEELATPAATPEKKTRVKRRTTSTAQSTPAEFPGAGVISMSMSAAKAIAVSAPLPEYPYQAIRAKITGSGLCVMIVDTASGKVTNAIMAQSTGNAILDKVTTNTFLSWRFKPGTVSQVRVPITYE